MLDIIFIIGANDMLFGAYVVKPVVGDTPVTILIHVNRLLRIFERQDPLATYTIMSTCL